MHMQFSENSQHSYFFSQPYQPFFILGFINSVVIMFIFMLDYQDIISMNLSSIHYHTYGFIYLLFTPVFFGFLFTDFPKFSSASPIETQTYIRVFSFFYIGSALFILGSIVTPVLTGIAMLILFIGHVLGFLILKNIYFAKTSHQSNNLFWIVLSMSVGVLSHLLFMAGILFHINIVDFATDIGIYLYLFLLTFFVAQQMIPSFNLAAKSQNNLLQKSIIILLILHIVTESFIAGGAFFIDIMISLLLIKEIYKWKLTSVQTDPLAWLLHISMYVVATGFMLSGLTKGIMLFSEHDFLSPGLHMVMLGFVLTMFMGFGTQMVLEHTKNELIFNTWTKALFFTILSVISSYLLASLFVVFGWDFMTVIELSVGLWTLLLAIWAVRYFPLLIKGEK